MNKRNEFFREEEKKEWLTIAFHERNTGVTAGETKGES